jgi:hypothetical protein
MRSSMGVSCTSVYYAIRGRDVTELESGTVLTRAMGLRRTEVDENLLLSVLPNRNWKERHAK